MTSVLRLPRTAAGFSASAHSPPRNTRTGLCGATALSGSDWTGLPLLRLEIAPTARRKVAGVGEPTLMAVKRGQVQLGLDKRHLHLRVLASAGKTSFLSPGEASGATWENTAVVDHLIVELPADQCERMLERPVRWAQPNLQACRFGLPDERLFYFMSALEEQCLHGEPMGTLYTEGISAALIAYVDHRYGGTDQRDRDGTEALTFQRRQTLTDFIDAHLSCSLRVADLATQVHCSPQQLGRLFQRSFGMAPHRYVMIRRTQHAEQLLKSDNSSIAEIAASCGFSSQAHLTVAFKALFGAPPASYRRRNSVGTSGTGKSTVETMAVCVARSNSGP